MEAAITHVLRNFLENIRGAHECDELTRLHLEIAQVIVILECADPHALAHERLALRRHVGDSLECRLEVLDRLCLV